MEIRDSGTIRARAANPEWFTGHAWQETVAIARPPSRLTALSVRFDPGARTAWHTHPLGQTLWVTAGFGLAQSWGEPARIIRAGDIVWFAPGEKHWHGAGAKTALTHLAMQEAAEDGAAGWLEKVSDEQYEHAALVP